RSPAARDWPPHWRVFVRNRRSVVPLMLAVVAALTFVGCGSSERLVSAPSSNPPAPGAVQVMPQEATTTPITVTSLVSRNTCPTLQFMVSSYVFKLTASTQYTGGTCASVQPGSRINFTGVRESETSMVFVVATLTFATTTAPAPPTTPPPAPPVSTPVQTEGTITAVGRRTCPAL